MAWSANNRVTLEETMMKLASILVWLGAAPAFGATFYVAVNGSDSAPGSSTVPWATVQHAVEIAGPGDTILVRAGIYKGARIEKSGLSGLVKTLRADAGAQVLLNAPGSKNRNNSILEVENFSATVGY